MSINLPAVPRDITGKKVRTLRNAGDVPVVLYGHSTTAQNLTINGKILKQIWHDAGSNQLVDLAIDGAEPVKVLIHDLQVHPVTDAIVHADLYKVNMTEKVDTEIPLKFVGESAAVKDLEGSLITEKDALEIRCLPAHLVAEFEVDISVLKTFEDVIKVSDIKVPDTIEVLNDPEEVIALVKEPISEEELEAQLAEPVSEEALEAIKTEGEEERAEREAAEAAEGEPEADGNKPKAEAKADEE